MEYGPLILVALFCSPGASAQNAEPTIREIETAYRSKLVEGGSSISGLRWERWRIQGVRGWSLKFKRLSEKRGAGILTRRYRALARSGNTCAEYQITDRIPFPPANPQIKPSLHVEPSGVKPCR